MAQRSASAAMKRRSPGESEPGGTRAQKGVRVARPVGGLGEEIDQAAARLGRGRAPVAGAAAVGREPGQVDDRLAQAPVADLGPPGVGPRLHDDVARRPWRRGGTRGAAAILPTPCSPTMRTAVSAPLTRAAAGLEPGSGLLRRPVKGTGSRGRLAMRWRRAAEMEVSGRLGGGWAARCARRSRRRTSAREGRWRGTRRRSRLGPGSRSGPDTPSPALSDALRAAANSSAFWKRRPASFLAAP